MKPTIQTISASMQFSPLISDKYQLIGQFEDSVSALKYAEDHQPAIIFIDYDMHKKNTGIYIRLLRLEAKEIKIILMGEKLSEYIVFDSLTNGGFGYIDKSNLEKYIDKLIEVVLLGEMWLDRHLTLYIIQHVISKKDIQQPSQQFSQQQFESLKILTQREIEIVNHIYIGENNLSISTQLFISVRTVKAHLTAIFKKLNVQDRFQLVVFLKNLHLKKLSD